MGQKIKTLGKLKIGDSEFEVELNKSVSKKGGHDIHIQNRKFRLEMSDSQFVQMASCLLLAKKQFDILKGGSDE
ncbi:MAG: hypothetical protein IJ530_03675 [Treponema sp.]|uniref:hypothetical protein n=1 Tax=Treponema sp. TaxID=166 RepID=UPI0025F423DE|nr:hypothetical protein [Treponema sp.]MBQ8678843.1 hypothetical protein [Treponema sp.]